MKFWDSSAVVPLLVVEQQRDELLALLQRDPRMLVWWGTLVECTAALARREREGALSVADTGTALERLRDVAVAWQEDLPSDAVRSTAPRLPPVPPLRAADSLQPAAAVIPAEAEPPPLRIVRLDRQVN